MAMSRCFYIAVSIYSYCKLKKANIEDDFIALNKLEAKYEFATQLISRCIIGIGMALLAFFVMKFLL